MIVTALLYYAWMKYALNRGTTPERQLKGIFGAKASLAEPAIGMREKEDSKVL